MMKIDFFLQIVVDHRTDCICRIQILTNLSNFYVIYDK